MALEKPMYNPIAFSPVATLTSDIAVGSTVIPVSDVNAFPPAPSYATIGTDENAETIKYSAKTADSLSGCTRAVEGVAQAWQTGEKIARNFTAKDHQAIIDNLKQLDEELQQAYSPNNKPTASDVGALPISGGTLTGSLQMASGKAKIKGSATAIELETDTNTESEYGRRILQIKNSDNSAGILSSAITLLDVDSSTYKFYQIYGEHNKELLTEAEKTLTLQNVTSGTVYYYKNADGDVVINVKDVIMPLNSDTVVSIATLPAGYRPQSTRYFPCVIENGNAGYLVINTGGLVSIRKNNGTSGTFWVQSFCVFKAVN